MHTSLHIGHFDSGLAALRPWKVITDAAEQAHDLQKKCPQPKAYGLKTKSYHIKQSKHLYERPIYKLYILS